MKQLIKTAVAALLFGAIFMPVLAEDTELFVVDLSDREGYRPKVLIIFDNSGSMGHQLSVKDVYDPNTTYPAEGSDNSLNDNALYYTVAGIDDTSMPVPGSPSERRRLNGSNNACAESLKPLALSGRFTGFIREFTAAGKTKGTWQELPDNNGLNVDIIDCLDDMNNRNMLNPYGLVDFKGLDDNGDALIESSRPSSASSPYDAGPGYPFDSGNKNGPVYTGDYELRNTEFHQSRVITLYTANYLRWYHSDSTESLKTRLAVAKLATQNLIKSVPGVDFGLMIFNYNYPKDERNGGRIVRGIEQSSAQSHKEVIDIIDGLKANTSTPLCETMYEAMRYFSGKSVTFGDDDSQYTPFSYHGNRPPLDSSVVSSDTYVSPFDECADIAYVILVTDGVPNLDKNADSLVLALDGVSSSQQVEFSLGTSSETSYLAALAHYMHNSDIYKEEPHLEAYKLANQGKEPKQTVSTYTIGFGQDATSAADLLKETALRGGGLYFEALDSVGLESSLYAALVDILLTDSSMTSPAIAANNFDRTRSLDNIYYSMFLPATGPRWLGNIKKLKLDASGILKDKGGNPAIDAAGNIQADAVTLWDLTNDSNFREDISKDGVNAALTLDFSSRKILTEDDSGMVSLNALPHDSNFASALGVAETEISDLVKWVYGTDIDDDDGDGSVSDVRFDLFGDPFHSKPLVMNSSSSPETEDLRILVGTNAGMLHMFKDNGESVSESWAFIPREFLGSQILLRKDEPTSDKLYGIDGSPVTYQHGDNTYLYFGLRRGGSAYYALDITSPDSPRFMWKIDANKAGFTELGQSWGRPVITTIPGYTDGDNKAKPVMLISGGYDINKDSAGLGSSDSSGRGLFFVDAVTGALVWSVSPGADSANNMSYPAFTNSMPAAPAILDSDGDGFTDRIYLSDTGGNVWRLDLYSSDRSNWSVYKFAELGGLDAATDRRFFYTPTITRTLEKTVKQVTVDGISTNQYGVTGFDAILIGSGDRTRLLSSKSVQDFFFMLKDEYISLTNFGTAEGEEPFPNAIIIDDLADITNDPIGGAGSATALLVEQQALSQSAGWRYQLPHNYEKAVGDAIVLEGTVYFTTFTPPGSPADGVCAQMGAGRVYAVNLHSGESVHNWRSLDIGERVPDTLVVHSGVNEKGESTLRILGAGQGDEVGFDLNKDGTIGETEKVNSGNILSSATMVPKKVHTHEQIVY